MGRVVVVGSLNSDHTVRVQTHPRVGETVLGLSYSRALGGKGFNQAITAARQGVDVVMVGCVGDDRDGDDLLDALQQSGADAGYVRRHAELPTGRAHITVDATGHNSIVVVPGANGGASFPSAALEGANVLLAQLEVPLDVITAALGAARAAGVTTVLNPAPARPLTERLLAMVDYLMPNETEAQHLGEVSFGGTAIITKGERGAVLLRPGDPDVRFDAVRVEAGDTTAAGDAFCGCFAASIAEGLPLHDSVRRASAAGAHAVTIEGALPSLPTRREVDALLR